MTVMLDVMDLAVSQVQCLSMGMGVRGERSLGKLQHGWQSINFHSVAVGHILLTTINAHILDK